MTEPTIGQRLDSALDSLALTASAQGAIGWLVQGETQKAEKALSRLNAEQLQAMTAAALSLAAIADRLARPTEGPTP
uniref:hypothetical protein n=1 Tax=Micromonospora sp. NBC_00855 TaxID=2975978 RepID=UPI00224FB6A3|nr:hypothetical protein OHB51_35340 [Micromonospora sp. NBC_00855]